jgi:hypothetical protein
MEGNKMAKEKRKFNKNFALMCIVPVLVLVVTMSIMGVTFAWFNDAEQTTIATLSLSTTQTFKMTFDIGAELNETKYEDYQNQLRYIYKGQTAYDKNGLLVTPVHAIEHYGYEDDSLQYKTYLNDQAFVAPFELKLDTNGYAEDGKTIVKKYAVDFNCVIEGVHIYNNENQAIEIKLPNNGKPDDTSDDVLVEAFYIVIFGDINGDAAIESIDATFIYDEAALITAWSNPRSKTYAHYRAKAADITGDGMVDGIDGDYVGDHVLGIVRIDQVTGRLKSK